MEHPVKSSAIARSSHQTCVKSAPRNTHLNVYQELCLPTTTYGIKILTIIRPMSSYPRDISKYQTTPSTTKNLTSSKSGTTTSSSTSPQNSSLNYTLIKNGKIRFMNLSPGIFYQTLLLAFFTKLNARGIYTHTLTRLRLRQAHAPGLVTLD